MLRNYCIIAWRTIQRNKVISFINIAGLAIGMASVILIALYVQDEKKFDRYFSNADRIYQVNLDAKMGGDAAFVSNTPPAVGPALKKEFPEIEDFTRFFVMGNEVVSTDATVKTQNHFTEKNILAVDSNFLQVFDYPMLNGNAATCLQKTHSIVLTETMAKKYFGTADVVGKNLLLDEYRDPFEITAVLKDVPKQSTIQFDMLIPTISCPPVQHFSWSWVWLQMSTYVLLNKNFTNDSAHIQQLTKKFPAMVKVQAAAAFKRIGQPYDEFIRKGNKWDFYLQPLTRVHLYSANINSQFLYTLGDIKYVYIFSAIALFIIILACVNFMNLSTAHSGARAKEVGVRKVLGSEKKQLIGQFLTEAMVYSVISLAIALALVAMLLPAFNSLSGKSLNFSSIFSSGIWIFILGLTLLTGLLAGSYPAFYLTSFNPVSVLKGGIFKKSFTNLLIRNGLVVFQFAVSIALIICTIILFQQLRYSQNKDLGLKKDNVIIIPNAEKMDAGYSETYRQQVAALPGVTNAALSSSVPTAKSFGDTYIPDATGVKELVAKDIMLNSFMADDQFIPALNIQLLQGRNFDKAFNDSTSVILNETAVKKIGWKNALGKMMTYPGHRDQRFIVVGVVKDFDVESIRNTVSPFALFHNSSKTYISGTQYLVAKTDAQNTKAILNQMEKRWKEFAPSIPFEYSFLDKNFEALYKDDQRMGTVFGIFTMLSILVAGLGLFGLSVYTTESRKKEIGVRKVLGASVPSILNLVSKEFLKLVGLAALVAFPLAGWAMNSWLQDFAYRISIQWWVFAMALAIALVIAMATISFQAVKAAISNPVDSLRAE